MKEDKHWLVKHGLAYWYKEEEGTTALTPKGYQALREWLAPYTEIESVAMEGSHDNQ